MDDLLTKNQNTQEKAQSVVKEEHNNTAAISI